MLKKVKDSAIIKIVCRHFIDYLGIEVASRNLEKHCQRFMIEYPILVKRSLASSSNTLETPLSELAPIFGAKSASVPMPAQIALMADP